MRARLPEPTTNELLALCEPKRSPSDWAGIFLPALLRPTRAQVGMTVPLERSAQCLVKERLQLLRLGMDL
jgi:hypothetical protein